MNMRRTLIAASLVGSTIILGITSGFFEASMMFVLLGEIPGRKSPIAADDMLGIWLVLGFAVVAYIANRSSYINTKIANIFRSRFVTKR